MNAEELQNRTKRFALRIIKLIQSLPKTPEAKLIGYQLLKSGTSVASNYRAVCRARSKAEFFAKISIVVEEADESVFWIELLIDSGIMKEKLLTDLLSEANEILKIMSKSRKTTKSKQKTKSINRAINKSLNQ